MRSPFVKKFKFQIHRLKIIYADITSDLCENSNLVRMKWKGYEGYGGIGTRFELEKRGGERRKEGEGREGLCSLLASPLLRVLKANNLSNFLSFVIRVCYVCSFLHLSLVCSLSLIYLLSLFRTLIFE